MNTKKLTILAVFTALLLTTTCGEDITSPQEPEKPWCDNAEMIYIREPLQEKLGHLLCAKLSPDENKIACCIYDDEIWIVNSDGTEPTLLYKAPDSIEYPGIEVATWSPDMQYIAFCMGSFYDERRLYYISVDGGEPIEIPTPPDIYPQYPDWSPDGEWILFYNEEYQTSDIYKIKTDGTELTNLTNNSPGEVANEARWSPDGKWIVYHYGLIGTMMSEIFKMTSDGGDKIQLTEKQRYNKYYPCWSPDGKWVAYSMEIDYYRYNEEWEPCDIWVTRADGSMESYQISNSLPDGEQPYDIFGDKCESWGKDIGILFWNNERDWQHPGHLGTQIFKIDPRDGWDFQ